MFVGVRVPLSARVEIGSIGFCTAGKEDIKSVFLPDPEETVRQSRALVRQYFGSVVSDKSGGVRQKSPRLFLLFVPASRACGQIR